LNRWTAGPANGKELWARRADLFPSLDFCESVEEQISGLSGAEARFKVTASGLTAYCESWDTPNFDIHRLGNGKYASGESQSTLNMYSIRGLCRQTFDYLTESGIIGNSTSGISITAMLWTGSGFRLLVFSYFDSPKATGSHSAIRVRWEALSKPQSTLCIRFILQRHEFHHTESFRSPSATAVVVQSATMSASLHSSHLMHVNVPRTVKKLDRWKHAAARFRDGSRGRPSARSA